MAGAATNRPEKWDAEARVQFVRFDDLKSQSRGCFPERTDCDPRSPIRAPSRHRQENNSLGRAHDNELRNTVGDLRKRISTDSVESCREECENILRSQRQESFILGRKECTKRDTTCVAEGFFKEEYDDRTEGQRIGRKLSAGGLCSNRNNDFFGGHFFRRGERINLPPQGELSRCPKNRNSLPLKSSGDLRKGSIDSGGTQKSFSHSSSRSRSTARGSNVDCPPLSHSRSVSSSSSRCITPRRLGSHQSCASPFRRKSILHCASRLADLAPEEAFKGHARNRTIFSRDYPPSKSKPVKNHGSYVSNPAAAISRLASIGSKVPGPRRISLIERYQRGLLLRKPAIRSKDSSSSRKKTRCPDSLSEQAKPASGAKDCYEMRHEDYWRGKYEEGLSPLRSPWREVPETARCEDSQRLHPRSKQLPADNLRRKQCRNPESYYPPNTRRESYHSSPPRFTDSFRYYDPSQDNSLPPFNYSNNSQMTMLSGNYSSPHSARETNLSYAPKRRFSYEKVDFSRDPCSYNDPQTTEVSFTCSRCLAAEELSSANDDTHPAQSYSFAYQNSQTPKDSFSSARPPFAAKDSSSSNDSHLGSNSSRQIDDSRATKDAFRCARPPLGTEDISSTNDDIARISSWPDENCQKRKESSRCARPRLAEDSVSAHNAPHSAHNLSRQKVNPPTAQDTYGHTRPHLGAKDSSLAKYDPHKSREFVCQNELEESQDREARLDDPHKARTSWRRNDLYQAKELCHTFSARDLFDDPVSKRDSCWYNDQVTAERAREATQDSWKRIHPADTEMEVSSSIKGSNRESWRPDLKRNTASKCDDTERDSWRQTGPHEAEKLAYPVVEPFFERDSWQNSKSVVAGRKFSTEGEPRKNIRHDNVPPIRIPCCSSEDNAQTLLASSRHYCQPQQRSNEKDVPPRVASRYPASVQRCGTSHYDDDNFPSSSGPREKRRTNEIRSP